MPTTRTPIKPQAKRTITPRALQIFKRVLLAKTIDDRIRIEHELHVELNLKVWIYFFGRKRWPVQYIDDASLCTQLEQVLEIILNRSYLQRD
jgi:hypothetical protein